MKVGEDFNPEDFISLNNVNLDEYDEVVAVVRKAYELGLNEKDNCICGEKHYNNHDWDENL